jgi:hypothetical protein
MYLRTDYEVDMGEELFSNMNGRLWHCRRKEFRRNCSQSEGLVAT